MNNKIRKITQNEHQPKSKIKGLLFSCTVLSSFFVLSSVASASDIEIYQPERGIKSV